jgi:histidyl-tRNA synthetase
MQTKALPGFREFYPDELALRTHIFRTWRTVASRYGFEEYDGPPLEPLDLYTEKSGDEIVGQLYNFRDKGDREVALRPEMTPTLARMVGARIGALKKPVRWFSIPQLFRYERQQRGRLKEHFQFNCDLIGDAGPLADAELMALAIDVMRSFGLGPSDVRLRVSNRVVMAQLIHTAGVGSQVNPNKVFQALDKIERRPEDWVISQLLAAGVPSPAVPKVLAVSQIQSREQLEAALSTLSIPGPGLEFIQTLRALDDMGLGGFVDIDFRIVRGLAYYTGSVFELFDSQHLLRAICGGGRYDNLLHGVSGISAPAVGFGMGDVVLGEVLRERGLVPETASSIDLFLAAITDEDVPHVLALAHELRDAGFRAEYALAAQAVGKQLKLADARNARFAVVIGPDDRARGEVMLKDLRGKAQESVPRDRIVERLSLMVRA